MNRKNKKLLTFMLTGALCVATLGGGIVGLTKASAEPTDQKYNLTDIFKGGSEVVTAEQLEDATAQTAKFVFAKDSDSVELNRNLAYTWFEGKDDAKYLSMEFSLKDTNFVDMSFVFETAPAQATEGGKAINTVKFVNESGALSVKVVNGEGDNKVESDPVAVSGTDFTLALAKGDAYGEFKVTVNEAEVGTFTNVGSNYANKTDVDTFVIKADVVDNASTAVYFKELNGQSFDNIVEDGAQKKVIDTTPPVLVVNSEVSTFLLGTAFQLDYEIVDVCKDGNKDSKLTKELRYYQWNPTDAEIKYENKLEVGKTYFRDTVYYKMDAENKEDEKISATVQDGYTATSVYREYNEEEYVSIRFFVGDDAFALEDKKEYFLEWYVEDTANTIKEINSKDYIIIHRNEDGPTYKNITVDETDLAQPINKLGSAWDTIADYTEFNKKLQETANEIYAGGSAEIKIPSVEWLIDDNNGYKAMSFTISYKAPSSSVSSTLSKLDYDELEIPAKEAGVYEFKIFATDAADNGMMYAYEGEIVQVSVSNVWEIEEIPSFTYEIKKLGVKVKESEDSDTLDTEILNDSYTMSDFEIDGISNKKSAYALYKIDLAKYNNNLTGDATRLTTSILSQVKFASLKTEVDKKLTSDAYSNYFELYKDVFAAELAKKVDGDATAIKAIFVKEIAEFDSRITEENEAAWNASDNKFSWNSATRSFKAAEEGLYLILADYWDDDTLGVDRVMAYQLIEVESEEDVIKGETNWLKNNLVSVILFSIAGVMLILIIVLLLIKPSNETLEDVEEKANKKDNQ